MENDEQQFRALLKIVPNEQPGTHFTGSVLKRVMEEAAAAEHVHELILSSSLTEAPSARFTASVMRELPAQTAWSTQPIITKRSWYAIAATVAITLLASIIMLYGHDEHVSGSGAMAILSSAVYDQVNRVPSIYPLTICAVAVLVCIDYFLRNGLKKISPTSPAQIV